MAECKPGHYLKEIGMVFDEVNVLALQKAVILGKA
jgi:hypothetical protein